MIIHLKCLNYFKMTKVEITLYISKNYNDFILSTYTFDQINIFVYFYL